MAVMTLKETQSGTIKAQLSDILMHVSWGDISREYFGKSGSWLYHKLRLLIEWHEITSRGRRDYFSWAVPSKGTNSLS